MRLKNTYQILSITVVQESSYLLCSLLTRDEALDSIGGLLLAATSLVVSASVM